MRMLSDMMDWVKEVPALPASNQRFGNLAFRSYIKLVEDVCNNKGLKPALRANVSTQ